MRGIFGVTLTKNDKIYFGLLSQCKRNCENRTVSKTTRFLWFLENHFLGEFFVICEVYLYMETNVNDINDIKCLKNFHFYLLRILESSQPEEEKKKIFNDNLNSYVFFVKGFGISFLSLSSSLLLPKGKFSFFFFIYSLSRHQKPDSLKYTENVAVVVYFLENGTQLNKVFLSY